MSNVTDRRHSVALQPAQTPKNSLCRKCPLRDQPQEAPARSHYLLGTGSSLRSQLCPPASPQSLSPGGGRFGGGVGSQTKQPSQR
jgi:hypothetical protein